MQIFIGQFIEKRSRMTHSYPVRFLVVIFMICGIGANAQAQSSEKINWKTAQNQNSDWYGSSEAIKIADNVLRYQNNNGGWLKNIDMTKELGDTEKAQLIKDKSESLGTTIDNGATHTQMKFLAKVYGKSGQERFKTGFLKGLDYLLEAQYENGGWAQYYPIRKGYYEHITFNDKAMIGVMELLREVSLGKTPYDFVDKLRCEKSGKAIEKGLAIILKAQIEVDGILTAWCAQHDKDDLSPAKARAYELPSISGYESVDIVNYLIELDQPDAAVRKAIVSAVAWFEQVKIHNKRVERKMDESLPRGYDNVVVEDMNASPIWARFYEIGTNRPIFVGRDGIVKYKLEEIEHERRVGYSYLRNYAEKLLEKNYPEWLEKWGSQE
jgi:PelA/Pel-15E family pectate lyase